MAKTNATANANVNENVSAFDWDSLEKKKAEKELTGDSKYMKFSGHSEGTTWNMAVTGIKSFPKDGEDVEVVQFETKEGKFVNGSALLVRAVKESGKSYPFYLRVIYLGKQETTNGDMDNLKIFVL